MKITGSRVVGVLISCLIATHVISQEIERIDVTTPCFNTAEDDYGLRIFGEHLMVVSAAKANEDGVIPKDEVTGLTLTDVWVVRDCKLEELFIQSSEFNSLKSFNSSLYDGPISSNKEANLLFFTNNSGSAINKLGIFYSQLTATGWTTPEAAPFNRQGYNVTHPYYDEHTDYLYFASDHPQGKGGYDIYRILFRNGAWGELEPLEHINTEASETFPVVWNDIIYYTTDKDKSTLGLELYKFQDGSNVRLTEPLNSNFDDLAIAFTSDSTGFISSNRNSAGQQDDVISFILTFVKPEVIEPEPETDSTSMEVVQQIKQGPSVKFGFDKATLSPEFKHVLDDIAAQFKTNENLYLIIEGHTDNIGPDSYNQLLSKRRAEEVRKYLVSKGLNPDKIIVEFYSFSKPIADNADPKGRAQNRRVDLFILEKR